MAEILKEIEATEDNWIIKTHGGEIVLERNRDVNNMGREDTLNLLENIGKIVSYWEMLNENIKRLSERIKENELKADEKRREYPRRITFVATMISVLLGIVICGVFSFIAGIICFIILKLFVEFTMVQKYRKKHGEELEAKAQEILAVNDNLYNEKNAHENKIKYLSKSGLIDWGKDIVGDDLFYSEGVQTIISFIKNRRADSLKEALRLYDESMHRMRVEEMQAATQRATEIAAREAIKQTAYSQEMVKNTQESTAYARETARNSQKIAQNTKK